MSKKLITDTPRSSVFDIVNKEIKKGDILAVAFRNGNGCELRVGRVEGFSCVYPNKKWSYNNDQIAMKWFAGDNSFAPIEKVTFIFAGKGSFVIISL